MISLYNYCEVNYMLLIIYYDGDILFRTRINQLINYPYNYIAINKEMYWIVNRKVIKCEGVTDYTHHVYVSVVR